MSNAVDVVVVGGGPAGSAAAYWVARSGHSVLLVEKAAYPREKTCGDGLTPRSIYELSLMGFDFSASEFHRITGLRSYAGDSLYLEMAWPQHSKYPDYGGVIRRMDLDAQVALLAEKEGAVIRQRTTAGPHFADGRLAGVELVSGGESETVPARVVVVADGSTSRFGRALGTLRNKDYPLGLAARGYFSSPLSHDGFMESQLDIRDEAGNSMPGYGWVFPLGDGTVNVGVGLLSTFRHWKDVNTTKMMADYVRSAPPHWELSEQARLTDPKGGKLLMSLSKGPRAGANWVVVGDAMGAINPWNGEGIAYGYETGRIAASHIHASLAANDLTLLQRYPIELDDTYGDYYRMARVFVKAIGYPAVMRTLAHTGLHSKPLMEWVLKVMANLLEEEDKSIGDRAYDVLEGLVRRAPRALTG
ncbi:MAG: geranylgeranyl reductase family protein [Acidimicrobiia bacterium]|nr:geranylgeranyl reductase family protein [Acidimicrobiia bacterium]